MEKIRLGEITKIRTGKLDANASSEDGQYPFFTCSRDPLKISTYSYDCECVLVAGNGGLASLLGTKDVYGLRQNYDNLDQETKDILDEMIYSTSRAISSLIPDFDGEKINQILITGGISQWPLITDKIKLLLQHLGIGITLYPGEKELESLRDCVLRIINKEETSLTY
jgi:butyrate kinase